MKRIATFFLLLYAGLWCLQQAPKSRAAGWLPLAKTSGGGGTVSLDTCGTFATTPGVTTFDFTGLTVGAGSNSIVASLSFNTTAPGVTSAIWNPGGSQTSLAAITNAAQAGAITEVELWGGVSASLSTGNQILRVSWTSSARILMDACSYKTVNTAGGTTSFPNGAHNTGTGTALSVAITSATGHWTQSGLISGSGTPAMNAVSATQFYRDSAAFAVGGSQLTGAATVTATGTLDVSDAGWAAVGTDIAP